MPIALCLIWMGFGPCSIGYMFIACYVLISIERVLLARYIVGMRISVFVRKVLFPLVLATAGASFASWGVVSVFDASFMRIVITSAASSAVFLAMIWCVVFDDEERMYILKKVKKGNGN